MNQRLTFFRVWILWYNGKAMLPRPLTSPRNYPDYQMETGWPVPLSTRQCARWRRHFTSCNWLTFHLSSLSLPLLEGTGCLSQVHPLPLYHLLSLSLISGPPLSPWSLSQISQPLLAMHGTEGSWFHGLIWKWTRMAVISTIQQPTGTQ